MPQFDTVGNVSTGSGPAMTITMPAKLGELYQRRFDAHSKLAHLRLQLEVTEMQVKALEKEWQETMHRAEKDLEIALSPPQAEGRTENYG